MNDLGTIMIWVFWVGFAVVIAIDIILAIASRRTFSRRARAFGYDVPVVAYVFGLLPTHFWFNFPIVTGLMAFALLLCGAIAVLGYEVVTAAPMHPIIAFVIGLAMGALFFPN